MASIPWQSGIGPLILLNLLLTFTISNISIGGHIGGLLGGAAAAYAVVTLGGQRRTSPAPLVACAALALMAVLGAIAVVG